MINIRNGAFETNSSSVHSLVIRKDSWFDNDIDDKYYTVKGGYYGRCPQIPLESTQEKLDYIWTMVNGLFGQHCIDWKNKIYEYVDITRFEKWKQMIFEICPHAELEEIDPEGCDVWIDHVYELEAFADAVESDPRILRYFLLSYSWIDISGDEYANWADILPYPWGEIVEINNHTLLYVKGN